MPPGDRREKLLMALRPFLKPERQEKLDRALRIAQLTQLAGSAFSPVTSISEYPLKGGTPCINATLQTRTERSAKTVVDEPPAAHAASAARAGLRAASAEAGACLPAGEAEAAGAGCPPKPLSLRGLLPETLDVGDLLLALILLLLYLDSEDEDPKSLLIIFAVCFFL